MKATGDFCERCRRQRKRAKRSGSGRNPASGQRAKDFGHRNRGRLRAPPGAEEASKKEWQPRRWRAAERHGNGNAATGHNGAAP